MIDRDDYTVRLMDLPEGVGGFINESQDGFLNIYINARHGWRGQRKSLDHELRHAEGDDLHSDEDLAAIEARADGVDPRIKAVPNLMRARDLAPPEPKPQPEPAKLSPRQATVLMNAISELDDWLFRDTYEF